MKCKKCKKEIPDDAKFCCYCGSKIEKGKMYRRKNGLYEKVITLDGKRISFYGKTEREVEQKIIQFKGVKEKGPLFKEVAEKWEESHFPTLAYNTQKSYRAPLKRAVEHFGDMLVKDIDAVKISAFLSAFAARKFSQKTVKNQLLVLNLIFEYAGSEGIIMSNPIEFVKIPKGLSKKKRSSPDELEIKLVKENCQTLFGMLAFFLLYTGLRKG